ncbi:MAG: hypothetical protein M5R40_14490 [Anaerolineae bacterium]|nr:hypothetical protein [Anaerolineae bacterium]
MATVTYTFQVDWDNDGDFSGADEDISACVLDAEWEIGYARPHDRAAAPGWLALTLDNSDRRFSPAQAAGPLHGDLLPMRYLRVQATHEGATYTLFYGYLRSIEPAAGTRGARRAVFHGVDGVALLDRYPLDLALQKDRRADEIIDAIVQAVAWPPALSGYWVLGVAGHAELGATTRLGGASVYRDFETGQETFAYAGDTWFPEQTTALGAIRETCASEYGRFHFTRAGKARFIDRHWPQAAHSVAAALDDTMADLHYRQAVDPVYNEVVVRMDPREAGAAGSVLWAHQGSALRLPANSARTVRAAFVTADGRRHGAGAVITPAPGTDFTANARADGSGPDYTFASQLAVSVTPLAAGADITFRWGAVEGVGTPVLGPIYVTALQLRGTPLKAFHPEAFAASDALSIARYQRRRLDLHAPLLNTPATGRAMAHYALRLHKDPAGGVARVTLQGGPALIGHILERTLFDVVRLSESQTGLDGGDYFIIAERHHVRGGGVAHTCTWRLEPVPPFKAWLLGVSGRAELGARTHLGF